MRVSRLVALAANACLLLSGKAHADAIIRLTATSPTVAVSGEEISFDLTLRNDGTDPSGPLALEINASSFLGTPQTPLLFCGDNPSPGRYFCIAPLLAPGQSVVRTVTYAVEPRSHRFQERANFSAYLYRSPGADIPTEGVNLVRYDVPLEGRHDLVIAAVDAPDPVAYGLPFVVVVEIRNDGPSSYIADQALALDVDLPEGVSSLNLDDALWTCVPNFPEIRCTSQMTELSPGTTRLVPLRITATGNDNPMRTGLQLQLEPSVIRGSDPDPYNNSARVTTGVAPPVLVGALGNCPFECYEYTGDIVECLFVSVPGLSRSSIGAASASAVLPAASRFSVMTDFRDGFLAKSAAGRRYVARHYAAGPEIVQLLNASPGLLASFSSGAAGWLPNLQALSEGRGAEVTITAGQIASLQGFLNAVYSAGSPELRAVIDEERRRIDLNRFVGMTMEQALAEFEQLTAPVVTLPVAATIRGAGGSFFHSDVRLYNPSNEPVEALLRFRCASGNCGQTSRSISLAPGQMIVSDDALGSLFGSADAFGAVEVEGDVLVDSRLYTPGREEPTSGFFAPGLTPDAAYPEAVLLALSHSNDRGRGFRTNLGFFNPNDVPLTATVSLHAPDASIVAQIVREVPARTALQINDVFREAGLTTDVPDAYAVVRTGSVHGLFTYAGIVDNRTQDGLLVRSRASRGGASGTVVLPVATSLPGVGGAYFRSDVRVFNPLSTALDVTARYRCSGGNCPATAPVATFTIAPGEMKVYDDAVATLFAAPGTLGAVEFSGSVYVDSRLYTPSRVEPSLGMYLAGGRVEELDETEAVITSLSHSPDLSTGFRTNIGIYNPFVSAQDVSVTIHAPDGTPIGSYAVTVAGKTLVQSNAFGTAGISQAVADAYAIVRTDGFGVVSYAAVADNRSQDPVFVPARPNASSFRALPPPAAASRRADGTGHTAAAVSATTLALGLAAFAFAAALIRGRSRSGP